MRSFAWLRPRRSGALRMARGLDILVVYVDSPGHRSCGTLTCVRLFAAILSLSIAAQQSCPEAFLDVVISPGTQVTVLLSVHGAHDRLTHYKCIPVDACLWYDDCTTTSSPSIDSIPLNVELQWNGPAYESTWHVSSSLLHQDMRLQPSRDGGVTEVDLDHDGVRSTFAPISCLRYLHRSMSLWAHSIPPSSGTMKAPSMCTMLQQSACTHHYSFSSL